MIALALLPYHVVATRFAAAIAAGFVVGLERETRGRSAGLRTTLLTCVGAAAAMILAENLFDDPLYGHADGGSISRVVQGIVTGIGFLGSGAITREKGQISGLTTAAVLWIVTMLGLAFGAGHYAAGATGVVITLVALTALRYAERFIPRDRFGHLAVTLHISGATDGELRERMVSLGASPEHYSLEYDLGNKQRTLHCDVRYRQKDAFDAVERLVTGLSQCRGVVTVDWRSG